MMERNANRKVLTDQSDLSLCVCVCVCVLSLLPLPLSVCGFNRYMGMYHPPKKMTGGGTAATTSGDPPAMEVVGVADEGHGGHGSGPAAGAVSLRDLRRAIRQQRDAKKPGDGLLFDPDIFVPRLTK